MEECRLVTPYVYHHADCSSSHAIDRKRVGVLHAPPGQCDFVLLIGNVHTVIVDRLLVLV